MRMVIEQRQMLKMVMTTELRQAIELLQLSTYELFQFIHEQVEENPLIELVEGNQFDFILPRPTSGIRSNDQEIDPLDFVVQDEKSLYDYLIEQVNVLDISETEKQILHFIILNLDEQGYLPMTNEEIHHFLQVSVADVEKSLRILHELEPLGVGARNVAECLHIQAQKLYPDDLLLQEVITHYLEKLADKKWQEIARALNISLEKVNELFEKIQTLNPKPGMNFSSRKPDYISPDIFVELDEEKGTYVVSLNQYYIPEIRFNYHYAEQLNSSKELAQYVNQYYKKYDWLQKSIEQRRETILKIMEVIIRRQRKFFEQGFKSLQPLTLKEVAEEIGVHESTVSRATANKIVQTPIGTFELRHLFSTRLATNQGSDASQTKVKELLKEIIDREDKQKPLSDQKIADLLKEEKGIVISRRTVAKYREEMNIPSSSKRKEIVV